MSTEELLRTPALLNTLNLTAIDFDTPWVEPMPVFEALAKRFPNHKLTVISDYLDHGVDRIRDYVLKNGRAVVSEGRK